MIIDFPSSPSVGDVLYVDSRSWQWTGYSWDASINTYGNMDGGKADSLYGGISPVVGGSAGSF
jgi:hypothetical protein